MRGIRHHITLILSLLFYQACAPKSVYHSGDIIFQTSKSSQSRAIQLATHSRYSHLGIIFIHHNHPYVLEAVQTVRWTPLAEWMARGEGGHYVIKRLKGPPQGLEIEQVTRMEDVGHQFIGKPYDLKFEWSDDRIYCSELVWKIYQRALGLDLGKPHPMKSFDLSDPAVRAKIRERFGAQPMNGDEPAISPDDIFNSPMLRTVVKS